MSALATESPGVQGLGLEDLRELLRSVNEATERLHCTHADLRGEVVRLRSELEQANAQLRRSRTLAALGEMAAGIAHEVRNPLASIRLNAQMLAEDLAGRAQQSGLCDAIAAAVERIEAIVRDVLRFARDTAPRPVPTTAAELLARALDECSPLLERAGVAVDDGAARSDPLHLEADPGLMVQALSNVIRNAAEAMEESGTSTRRLVLSALWQRRRSPGARRAPCIVRDVLRFARDTAPRPVPTTAAELLARALDECSPLLERAGVAVDDGAARSEPLHLEADLGLMVQALSNVIRNAAEAMEESGTSTRRLVLSALWQRRRSPGARRAPCIVLGIEDTGPGISPEVLARMFNPFFTTRRAGTGLGLAIVHRIVEAHGGHVTVTNRPQGGAAVELCLPRRPRPRLRPSLPSHLPSRLPELPAASTNGAMNDPHPDR